MAKLPNRLLPIALLMMAAGSAANAQNSDLGLLLGVIASPYDVIGGSRSYVSTSVGVAGQINYAYQVKGWRAGDLYLEIPFLVAVRNENWAGSGGASITTKGVGAVVPGVRFKLPLGGRASLYAAGGVGFGIYGENVVSGNPGGGSITNQTTATAAFDFGGGLDLRLTKLLSLRGEVRDLIVSPSSLSNSGGRNNPIFGFGFAFHF
jgi:hypothetical protein